jgi:multicomponent Na+:H+ antiporter subunit G
MSVWIDGLSWICLVAGSLFCIVGAVGVVRMPDLYTRMHAASITDSLGSMLIIAGVILQAGFTLAAVKLAAILVFLLFTSPTAANALASAALLAGINPGLAAPWRHEPRS